MCGGGGGVEALRTVRVFTNSQIKQRTGVINAAVIKITNKTISTSGGHYAVTLRRGHSGLPVVILMSLYELQPLCRGGSYSKISGRGALL